MGADVQRYCMSCDACQHSTARGKTKKIPLGKMPLIDTPFERVAVDIISPVTPAASSGNRYILTVVDYATRYVEAKPLKHIRASDVTEAL